MNWSVLTVTDFYAFQTLVFFIFLSARLEFNRGQTSSYPEYHQTSARPWYELRRYRYLQRCSCLIARFGSHSICTAVIWPVLVKKN